MSTVKMNCKRMILMSATIALMLLVGVVSGNSMANGNDPLPSGQTIDWSTDTAGVSGEIPDRPSNPDRPEHYGERINPNIGTDTNDDWQAFQNAIDSAKGKTYPSNVVYIPAGTYYLDKTLKIDQSVILRGAGKDQTHLMLSVKPDKYHGNPGDTAIFVQGWSNESWRNITSGANKGSTQITVANVDSFVVGGFFEIQMENNGDVDPRDKWNPSSHQVGQLGEITAIDTSRRRLTLREPLNIDYGSNTQIRPRKLVENVGIESLHLDRTDTAGRVHPSELEGFSASILWQYAANVWVDEVESEWGVGSHVMAHTVYRCEIRNSDFEKSHYYGTGGNGYGVSISEHTTACLVENNTFDTLRHSMVIHDGANGNVIAYNYSQNPEGGEPVDGGSYYDPAVNYEPIDLSIHGHFPFSNLFEGNIVSHIGIGDWWGPSGVYNTYHRNCVTEAGLWYWEYSDDQNITGNLVQSSTGGTAQIDQLNGTTKEIEVYFGDRHGDADRSGTSDNVIEHGNYVDGAMKWDSRYSRTIIDSYYLDSAPSFYGQSAWPSVGASYSGGTASTSCTNPAKQRAEGVDVDVDNPTPGGGDSLDIYVGSLADGWDDWSWNVTGSRFNGSSTTVTAADYGGLQLKRTGSDVEAGNYASIQIDVKANQAQQIKLSVRLDNGQSVETTEDVSTSWNTITLPLDKNGSIDRFVIQSMHLNDRTFSVRNMRLINVPVQPSGLDIYADSLADGWNDWSWNVTGSRFNGSSTTVTATDYGGLQLKRTGSDIEASDYASLQLDIKADDAQRIKVNVRLESGESVEMSEDVSTSWDTITLPLNKNGSIDRFFIQSLHQDAHTFSVRNIRLIE